MHITYTSKVEARVTLAGSGMRFIPVPATESELWVSPVYISEGEGHSGAPVGHPCRTVCRLHPDDLDNDAGPGVMDAGEIIELSPAEQAWISYECKIRGF